MSLVSFFFSLLLITLGRCKFILQRPVSFYFDFLAFAASAVGISVSSISALAH